MGPGQTDNGKFVHCRLDVPVLTIRGSAELQKSFFPPTYQNVQETPHLKPGDKRVWTAMQIFIELRDDTTFYIPFREASKVFDPTH
jgi:hypothetical protein